MVACVPLVAQPRAVPGKTIHDVGRIDDQNNVDVTFTIANQGDRDLLLTDVVAACGCTVVNYEDIVKPGSSGAVDVTLKPQGYSGAFARSVRVYTNDAGNPYIDFTIKAAIAPSVYMLPGYARFMGVAGEPIPSQSQTLWAADFDGFEVLGVDHDLDFVEFSIREAGESERVSSGSARQWVVEGRITGEVPAGPFNTVARVRTNHPARSELQLPIFGERYAPLRSVPAVLELGDHAVGSEIEASVRLDNLSQAEVEYGPVELAPGSAGTIDWSIEDEQDRTYLVLFFRRWPRGPVDTTIRVQTSHPEQPVLNIPVTGAMTSP